MYREPGNEPEVKIKPHTPWRKSSKLFLRGIIAALIADVIFSAMHLFSLTKVLGTWAAVHICILGLISGGAALVLLISGAVERDLGK